MEDETTKEKKITLCEVCGSNPAKYRCPGCEQRTCSLTCVKKHKTNSGCNGKRNKTAYISMKGFTDSHLHSDYRFLEDGERKSQSCHRDYLKKKHDKPKSLMKLVHHAKTQGIEMRTMPYPMSKRKNNRTFFLYRTKEILWQIEWIFPQADVQFIDKKQSQNFKLETLLNRFIHPTESDPVMRHKLRQYVSTGLTECRLLMKVEGISANNVRYHELDVGKTVLENLQGKCVVEYPSILVVLSSQCQDYNVLSKEEEDKLWQDRRKGNFTRQTTSSVSNSQKSSDQGHKSCPQITGSLQLSKSDTNASSIVEMKEGNDRAEKTLQPVAIVTDQI